MKMRCPQCGVKGSADDKYLGRRVKCPKCQEIFTLTAVDDEVEELKTSPLEIEEPAKDVPVPEESLPEVEKDTKEYAPEAPEEVEGKLFDDISSDEENVTDEEVVESLFDDGDEEKIATEEPEESLSIDDFFTDQEQVEEDGKIEIEEPEDIFEETTSLEEEVVEESAPVEEISSDIEEPVEDDEQTEEILLEEEDELELTESLEEETAETDVVETDEQLEDSEELLVEEEDELILDEELAVELEEQPEKTEVISAPAAALDESEMQEEEEDKEPVKHVFSLENLTVSGAIKEAWKYTKGAKLKLLLATLVVTVLSAVLNVLVAMGLPFIEGSVNGMFPGAEGAAFGWVSSLSMFFISFLSSVFGAGLLYMGVKRVADEPISIGMVFSGFSRALALFFGFLFMTLMIISGLVLLVLPGIYLMVGYTLTLPLIIDKKMQPWEAMEASRKAIHKVWWTVFGIFIVMGIILNVAMIPLGLGLIWAIPMYVIIFGVIYRVLFKE